MKYLRSFICVLVVMSVLASAFIFTGCSQYFIRRNEIKCEEMVTYSLNRFLDSENPDELSEFWDDYSDYKFSPLTKEQEDLFIYSLGDIKFSVESVLVSENMKSATVKVKFNNLVDFDKIKHIGTEQDYKNNLDKSRIRSKSFKFKLVRKNNKWIYKDLSDLFDFIHTPVSAFCVLNEDGTPINITDEYIKSVVKFSSWYDSLLGNPITNSNPEVNNPVSIVSAFYFDGPVTMDITCKLYKDNDEILSLDKHLDSEVIAIFDFPNKDNFSSGNYKCVLYYDGIVMCETDVIRVNQGE